MIPSGLSLFFVAGALFGIGTGTEANIGDASPDSPYGASIDGQDQDAELEVHAQGTRNAVIDDAVRGRSNHRYQRHDVCLEWLSGGIDRGDQPLAIGGELTECAGGISTPPPGTCEPGETVLPPLFRSTADGAGGWGPWVRVGGYGCDTDALYAAAIDAWRSMAISPTAYEIQPDTGYAVASLGVVPIAQGGPQTTTVTLLGANVQLRATPTEFHWSTTDGDSWTATEPGASYANGGEPHLFAPGERRIQLTLATTWAGEFSLNGGATWIDAPGTATTTSDTTSIHVYSPRSRLVDCDLNGDCGSSNSGSTSVTPALLDPDGDGVDNYTIPDAQIAKYLASRDD